MTQPLLSWNAEFELGVDFIDEQHKGLLVLVNEVARLIQIGAPRQEAVVAVEELLRESHIHFDFEESKMVESSYGDHALHHEVHSELLAAMERLRDKVRDAYHSVDKYQSLVFLQDWFRIHITKSDAAFAQHLRQHITSVH